MTMAPRQGMMAAVSAKPSSFEPRFEYRQVGGVRLHCAMAGEANRPLVILLHGFPEFWFAWRDYFEPLVRAGYRVITADNGRNAWQVLVEQGCDMLVTDLEMPIEGGFALLERLRADRQFSTLPAIVISSKANAENRRRAQELDVFEFMPKPVSQQDLVDTLRAMRRDLRD